ncbi:tetratricopeptide repeat protein [Sorangium sp. So ce131]|uniref:tetratricopeptide repeat protein n=1 Tax=Sorangium sp. So ce131 TaxID=3133282 RepID=UPI003F5DD402
MTNTSRLRSIPRSLALGAAAVCLAPGCRRDAPQPAPDNTPPAATSAAAPAPSASSAALPAPPAPPTPPASSARPLTEKEKQALATYKAALARGRLATQRRDFKAAIQAFTEAVEADPTDARAVAERGFAHLSAGDSAEAESDFSAALTSAGEPELRAQVWYNLGLLRDKAGDAGAARVAYANAHLLKPSPATRAKLAGRSTCAVEIRKTDLENAEIVPSWTELLARVGLPSDEEGAGEAAGEAAARARLCEPKGGIDRPCAGDPPWIFARDYMMFAHHRNHVVLPRKPAGFVVVDGGHTGGWPARCHGIREVAGSVQGGLLVVDASFDGTGSVFDKMVNDEFVCLNGVSHRERTYYDVRTGRAVVALRWPGSSEVHVKVEGGHVVVSGAGCNERFRLDAGAE